MSRPNKSPRSELLLRVCVGCSIARRSRSRSSRINISYQIEQINTCLGVKASLLP